MWFVLVVLVALGVLAIVISKKKTNKSTNYFSLFVMGIVWFPLGLVMWIINRDLTIGNVFTVLGFVYLAMGLAHKSEWKKNRRIWDKLKDGDKWLKIVVTLLFVLLILAGFVVFAFI